MEERIWELFVRRVSGELSREEKEEFEQLVLEQPECGRDMQMILAILSQDAGRDQDTIGAMAESLWPRLEAAIRKNGSSRDCTTLLE